MEKLTVGNTVNYPGQGPCRIDRIANRSVEGTFVEFYHLVVLADGGDLYVPVHKAKSVGVRPLLKRSEILALLDQLKQSFDHKAEMATNAKQRVSDNMRVLSSGSALHLAEMVKSLAELKNTKSLGLRETQILDRARKLLISEIAVVLEETTCAAEERLDSAINSSNKGAAG